MSWMNLSQEECGVQWKYSPGIMGYLSLDLRSGHCYDPTFTTYCSETLLTQQVMTQAPCSQTDTM